MKSKDAIQLARKIEIGICNCLKDHTVNDVHCPELTCQYHMNVANVIAAERERAVHYIRHLEACVENMPKGMGDLTREWLELKEQLAAERKKAISVIHERTMEVARLDDQLAAEQRKLKGELANGTTLYRQKITLEQQLKVLLDCVDYKAGNCRVNEPVGAVLSTLVIDKARDVLKGVKPK